MNRRLIEHVVNEVIDMLEAQKQYEVWRFDDPKVYQTTYEMRFTPKYKFGYDEGIQKVIEYLLDIAKRKKMKPQIANTNIWNKYDKGKHPDTMRNGDTYYLVRDDRNEEIIVIREMPYEENVKAQADRDAEHAQVIAQQAQRDKEADDLRNRTVAQQAQKDREADIYGFPSLSTLHEVTVGKLIKARKKQRDGENTNSRIYLLISIIPNLAQSVWEINATGTKNQLLREKREFELNWNAYSTDENGKHSQDPELVQKAKSLRIVSQTEAKKKYDIPQQQIWFATSKY